MTGKGWTDGSDIRSKPFMNEATRDEFDRIFKHGKYSQGGNTIRDIPEDKPIGVDLFEGSPEYLERTKKEWEKENQWQSSLTHR